MEKAGDRVSDSRSAKPRADYRGSRTTCQAVTDIPPCRNDQAVRLIPARENGCVKVLRSSTSAHHLLVFPFRVSSWTHPPWPKRLKILRGTCIRPQPKIHSEVISQGCYRGLAVRLPRARQWTQKLVNP